MTGLHHSIDFVRSVQNRLFTTKMTTEKDITSEKNSNKLNKPLIWALSVALIVSTCVVSEIFVISFENARKKLLFSLIEFHR